MYSPGAFSPSPFILKAAYVIAGAGLFALLPEDGDRRISRPFPLVWGCYDGHETPNEPLGLARARFQGFAAVSACPAPGGPALPEPGPLRYLAADPLHGRRLFTSADGPDELLHRLAALPCHTPARDSFLTISRSNIPGRLALGLSPQTLRDPGVLCLHFFSSAGPTNLRSVFLPLPGNTENGAGWHGESVEAGDADYVLAFLLHESAQGTADFLQAIDYGHPGFRYSLGKDEMVATASGQQPHGRQAFPPVYALPPSRAVTSDPAGPAARYAALCALAVKAPEREAESFTTEARGLGQRMRAMEQAVEPASIPALKAFRQEALAALMRINAHHAGFRSLELHMQDKGFPPEDDSTQLSLRKIFPVYGRAINHVRALLLDILQRRLPGLHRRALLHPAPGYGDAEQAARAVREALSSEPCDPDGLRMASALNIPLGPYALNSTARAYGPFPEVAMRLASVSRGSVLLACAPATGSLHLLEPESGSLRLVAGEWNSPVDVCSDGTEFLVLDAGTRSVTRIDAQGRLLATTALPELQGESGRWEAQAFILLDGVPHFMFSDQRGAKLCCVRQGDAGAEALFRLNGNGFFFAGWAAWQGQLVLCNANHAALSLRRPNTGAWENLPLPLDLPQFTGLSVAGDFAYLACPPFMLKYDLQKRSLVYSAHRMPMLDRFPRPMRGLHVVDRPDGQAMYLMEDDRMLHEFIVHVSNPEQRVK